MFAEGEAQFEVAIEAETRRTILNLSKFVGSPLLHLCFFLFNLPGTVTTTTEWWKVTKT